MSVFDRFKKPEPTPEVPSIEESVAQISDGLDVVRSAVVGYRAKLEADGFSPTMAETMAANLFAAWIGKVFS